MKIDEVLSMINIIILNNRCNKCLQIGCLDSEELQTLKEAISYIESYKKLTVGRNVP